MKKIYGLIGYPVKHSFSPAMHNAAFNALDIDAEYKLFEIAPGELKDFLLNPAMEVKDTEGRAFYAKDISGFNITIPHKVKAKDILENTSLFKNEEPYYVELSGAINTVKRDNNGGYYWNTDSYGFESALNNELNYKPRNEDSALVIGCGGVGRVIISVLSKDTSGIKRIYIYDKSDESRSSASVHFAKYYAKYPHMRDRLKFIPESKIAEAIQQSSLLVNASPVGMRNDAECPVPEELLHNNLFVYDVVYNRKTRLIESAGKVCRAASNGLSMLLYQGAYAFSLWTGKPAPLDVMKYALEKRIMGNNG